ncbi:MAG TPA: hypothetical protein VFQ53_13520 [Kofleriaceae bacterium]|nr:hypothetical protein [Kofleriaceae bacterium]
MRRWFLLIVLAGCGSKSSTSPAAGPMFTPLVANHLRALAPDCALQRTTDEVRTCKGELAKQVVITLDSQQHLRSLDIELAGMFSDRAKILLDQALAGVVDTAAFTPRLEKLKLPQTEDVQVGGAHVTIGAKGQPMSPEFSVQIRW